MTPPTPVPPSTLRAPRRLRVRLFALGAVAVLIAYGAVLALTWPSPAPAPEAAASSGAGTGGPGFTAKASPVEQLNALAAFGPDPATAIRLATADSTAAFGSAQQALAAAVAASLQEEGMAKLPTLPALPDGYIPGMDLAAFVKVPKPAPFPLPVYGGNLALPGLETKDVVDALSPVVPQSGPHAPPTGSGPADAALAQLLQSYRALARTLSALNTSSLPLSASGVLPDGLLPPLEVPAVGSYPAQAQDANDAADPDERGAALATRHAGELLASVEAAHAVSKPSLAKVLAAYQGLAERVELMVEEARNATSQAELAIQAQLEERLASIEASAEQARAQALQLAVAHQRAAEALAQKAHAALRQAASAQATLIQEAAASDLAALQQLAAQAESAATARKAEVQALAAEALAKADASGATETALAIQAAGEAALKKLGTEGLARTQAFQAAATDLQARAQSALRQLQRSAGAAGQRVNATVEQALQQADDTKAYLVGMARAQADAAVAAQQAAADATLAKLPTLEQARVAKIVQSGLQATGAADTLADSVGDLAERVAGLAGEQVGKDIGYIAKVSADYGRIPTSQRLERADFWAGVAGLADQRLDAALLASDTLEGMAAKVLLAAQQAEAHIEALA